MLMIECYRIKGERALPSPLLGQEWGVGEGLWSVNLVLARR